MISAKELLENNYALERVIGCGETGVVVAARHTRLELRVALKFLRPDRPRNAEAIRRLVREGRITARIQNTHVTRVLDIGKLPGGEPFLVMELLEGSDLAALLAARGPLSSTDAVAYVRQACVGLASAHALGIVHRDLEPSNLFLTSTAIGSALVKIIDFGIAEQSADAKSDVAALGATLFTLLTGQSAFERPYHSGTYRTTPRGRGPDLRELRPDIEHPLATVVERCLAKEPGQRFASAAELGAALARIAIADTIYPRYDGARTTGSHKICPPPSASQAPPALKALMS